LWVQGITWSHFLISIQPPSYPFPLYCYVRYITFYMFQAWQCNYIHVSQFPVKEKKGGHLCICIVFCNYVTFFASVFAYLFLYWCICWYSYHLHSPFNFPLAWRSSSIVSSKVGQKNKFSVLFCLLSEGLTMYPKLAWTPDPPDSAS
jgi:hypothetical protein